MWDAGTGERLPGFTRRQRLLGFSPDLRTLVAGGGDKFSPDQPGEVTLWDVTGSIPAGLTPARAERATLRGHRGYVTGLAFSPDGTVLATAGHDGTARLWDAATGKAVPTLDHQGPVHALAFSPDGRTVATAVGKEADGNVHLWDAATGAKRAALEGHAGRVATVAFGPGGVVVTASHDRTVNVWEPADNSAKK